MRLSSLRLSSGLLLALAWLAASSTDADSVPASPPDNLNINHNNAAAAADNLNALATPTSYSPFLPGLLLDNVPLAPPHLNAYPAATPHPSDADDTAAPAAPATTADPFWGIQDLKKRQGTSSSSTSTGGTTCPTSYTACAALGAPGLCCRRNSRCAVDQAGHVACCPSGAVCTGSLTAGAGVTRTVSGVTTVTGGPSSSLSFVLASSTVTTGTGGGFIVVASSTVATPNGAGKGRRGLIPVVGWFL
ncbi:hypothetical protein B0J12DRAFT_458359 [Macrophomina phaseolina]|uniref:Uncharacterized protein n=1 Tax=Macrophomina phaseolina TaxID=35725 RepID=A0ABQ8GG30_9PEZI|nr:hypothetical protein B0J12DRAFT_458359 [Macrophomina phaseolina]